MVIDARLNGTLGIPFVAFAPFVGVAIGVYMFGKVSMANFNPAVTLGLLATKHITKRLVVLYITAEIMGALSSAARFPVGNPLLKFCQLMVMSFITQKSFIALK